MKSSAKRLLSLVIVLAMALSMLPMVTFAAGTTTTVYCQAPSGWSSCKAYWWGSKTGTNPSWPGVAMEKNEAGIWVYDVPSDATGLIFNNGSGTQTSDLKVPTDEKTMYVFSNRQWVVPEGPVEEVIEYFVAGTAALCGVDWNPSAEANKMTQVDGSTVYQMIYTNVAAGTYEFKVTNGTWDQCWGAPNSTANFTLTLEADTEEVKILFDSATGLISVNDVLPEPEPLPEPPAPGTQEFCLVGYINGADYGIEGDSENVGEYIFVDGKLTASFTSESYIFVKTTNNEYWYMTQAYTEEASASFVLGGSEKMKVPANVVLNFTLVENEDGTLTLSYTTGEVLPEPEPTPVTYIVAGVAELCGSAWTADDANNAMSDEDGDGIYTKVYSAVAAGTYLFKVTNGTWDQSWGGTAADGNYEFTLSDICDVTIKFNSADGSITVEADKLVLPEPPVPGTQEYALVGYINGADYGCNDDYANVGEYIFVDGKLTASFTADSYVFVKTTDNANWYLANAYTEETSVILVKDASEKLKVPANVELTFTLVENEDGTLTLSYTTGEVLPEPEPTPVTYIVAGVAELCGSAWTADDANNAMSDEDGDGIYTKVYSAVAAGTYEFKVTNGTWDQSWGGTAANGNYEFTLSDTCDVTIKFNSADGSITVEADKLVLPEPPVPGTQEYALVGYINGADYGCNEDWENVGEYIFVDGKLTATFTADSYVFVKTTDNANWYLANAYTEETSVILVKDASEKMKVPAGVELTFTLVENEDGTLTLSYETASAGYTVSGAVKTGAAGDVTVELIADGNVVATATATGKEGTYSIENVAAGTYTLKVSQLNHVTREYTVTVEGDLTQDVKIHMIGDIDGNGKINVGDVSKLNGHIKGNKLTDEYMILCANVNGGKLNMGDVSTLYAHIKGTKKLY